MGWDYILFPYFEASKRFWKSVSKQLIAFQYLNERKLPSI
jgi:hypothetical protein